jgi:hypothetical protein
MRSTTTGTSFEMGIIAYFLKESPAPADVHVSTTGGGRRKKPKTFGQALSTIGQDTKLPVTGADLAAQQENPQDKPAGFGKRGARNNRSDRATIQAIHDHARMLGAACDDSEDDPGNPTGGDGDDWLDDAVSQLGKRDFSIPFTVAKIDKPQQLIFGWASVVEKSGQLIVDKQNDVILPEDLEKAAYNFVLYARKHGDMHDNVGTGRMVESMVFTKEKQDILGIDLGKVGWWTGFKVDDPVTWAAHERGDLTEFSIGGRGRRIHYET